MLWISANCQETFIRDYKDTNTTLTGLPLSPHLDLVDALRHVRNALQERHKEWFIILAEANTSLQGTSHSLSDVNLIAWLPNCGQILVTCSEILIQAASGKPNTFLTACGIDIPGAKLISVEMMEEEEIRQYFDKTLPLLPMTDCDDNGSYSHSNRILTLALSRSNMHYLGMSVAEYCLFYERRLRRAQYLETSSEPSVTMSRHFSITMDLTWSILHDRDQFTVDLLFSIALVGSRQVPVSLIRKLPPFVHSFEDLLDAIRFAEAMSLVQVGLDEGNPVEMSMHRLVHIWLQPTVKRNSLQYSERLSQAVAIVNGSVSMEDSMNGSNKMWTLLPHIRQLINNAFKYELRTVDLVSLSHKAAVFLHQQGLFRMAETLITAAVNLAFTDLEIDELEIVLLRESRAKILLALSSERQAEIESIDALVRLSSTVIDEEQKAKIHARICDELSVVLLRLGKLQEAERLLKKLLALTHDKEDVVYIRRHYRMATCLNRQSQFRGALQHSHVAMSWVKRNHRWDEPDTASWIDLHASLLFLFQNFRGALMFFPYLLKRYLETLNPSNEAIWRTASLLSISYRKLKMYDEQEKVAEKILEICNASKLQGLSLCHLLEMLSKLAATFRQCGRVVESEGINIYILRCAMDNNLPGPGGRGNFNLDPPRLNLLLCFYQQGKLQEAKELSEEYSALGLMDGYETRLQGKKKDSELALYIYESVLENKRAGEPLDLDIDPVTSPWWCNKEKTLYWNHIIFRYGSLERRIEEETTPSTDIDSIGLEKARKSKLLHLIGFYFAYGAFISHDGDRETWSPKGQATLLRYFSYCACRRHRQRSASLHCFDLSYHRYVSEREANRVKRPRESQALITNWFKRTASDHTETRSNNLSPPPISQKRSNEIVKSLISGKGDEVAIETSKGTFAVVPPPNQPFEPVHIVCPDGTKILVPAGAVQEADIESYENDFEVYIVDYSEPLPTISIDFGTTDGSECGDSNSSVSGTSHKHCITDYFGYDDGFDDRGAVRWNYAHKPHRLEDILEDEEDENELLDD